MTLRRTRHLDAYTAIKELSETHGDYPVSGMCRILGINRAAYYKWKSHDSSRNDTLNELIAEKAGTIHAEHPDMVLFCKLNDATNITLNEAASV